MAKGESEETLLALARQPFPDGEGQQALAHWHDRVTKEKAPELAALDVRRNQVEALGQFIAAARDAVESGLEQALGELRTFERPRNVQAA